jgi:hypothetical protein
MLLAAAASTIHAVDKVAVRITRNADMIFILLFDQWRFPHWCNGGLGGPPAGRFYSDAVSTFASFAKSVKGRRWFSSDETPFILIPFKSMPFPDI